MTMLSIFDEPETDHELRGTYVRYYVDGRRHGKRVERPPFGVYGSFQEALERSKQVLRDEYPNGGVVTINEVHIFADTHEGASSQIVHESRR